MSVCEIIVYERRTFEVCGVSGKRTIKAKGVVEENGILTFSTEKGATAIFAAGKWDSCIETETE